MTRTATTYARVSGEEQARKGYSLSDQREALRLWCEAEGYTIIEEVDDEGWSGGSLTRPGMDRVRDLMAAGGVDAVVVLFRDRLARGVAAQLLVEEFAERGTRLCALNAQLDDSPEGELQGGMLDLIAGWERRKIAQRTTRGRLAKAKKGLLIATHTPHFGFRYTPDRAAYLIDESAMKTVARVFELIGDRGLTLYGTAKALQAEAIPAPAGGSRWGEKTIRDIVRDDVYLARSYEEVRAMVGPEAASRLEPSKSYGIVWYPRRKVTAKPVAEPDGFGGKRYRKVQTEEWRPLSECVPIPVVDSTIPPDLVRAARGAIEHNAVTSRTGERLWELTGGVLRCGACGCRMVANRKRNGSEPTKTYNYYRCPTAQRTGACENRKSHRAEPLEEAVWDHVWPLLEHPELVLASLELRIRREKERVNPEVERRRLVGVIEGAEAKRAKFQHAYAEEAMTLDDLKARAAEIDEQIHQAQERLESVQVSGNRLSVLERLREIHLRDTAVARATGRPPTLQRVEVAPKHRVRTYRNLGVRAVAEADGRVRISGRWFSEPSLVHIEDQSTSWSPTQNRVL